MMGLACVLLANVRPAVGQEGIGPRIQKLFDQTKQAKTVEDFTQIVDQGRELREQAATEERRRYLDELVSWALNSRGESYVRAAAEVTEESQARRLDEAALADFDESIQLDERRWKAFHNRGVTLALAGRHEEADADFTRAIELKPDHVNAWFNRAELRLEVGQLREALADYEEALRRSPQDAGARLGRGRCRQRSGQYEAAIADFTAAAELDPDNVEPIVERAATWEELKDWEAAARDYRAAQKIAPDQPRALRGAAWLMAACPEERYRDARRGIDTARRAAELDEQLEGQISAWSWDVLAAAQANAGQWEDAVESAGRALDVADDLDPATAEAVAGRLRLYQSHQPFRLAGKQVSASGDQRPGDGNQQPGIRGQQSAVRGQAPENRGPVVRGQGTDASRQ